MLLLELVLEAVVEEGEQELLAAGAEAAGRAVERREREVLELAGDPADVRQLPVLAGVGDTDGPPRRAGIGDAVARARRESRDRRDRHGGAGERRGRAPGAGQQDQRREQRETRGDDERGPEGRTDGAR